ncbi:MAG: YraN family protein [bacterium]|nr:YraN family protein [bacterium]
MPGRSLGERGEEIAGELLRRRGYRILARNYRCPRGEIDLIARDRDVIVFVEVKGRGSGRFGSPLEAVTPRKRRRLAAAALHYLASCGLLRARTRFDVVGIRWGPGGAPEIALARDAFRLEE